MVRVRARKAINGLLVDIGGQFLSLAVMMLAIKYIYLPNTSSLTYGYWIAIGSIITWLAISDLGIGMALSRMLITIQGNGKEDQRDKAINTSFISFFFLAIFFVVLSILVFPFVVTWFSISTPFLPTFKLTYYLCIIAGAISMPLSVFGGIIEANQQIALNRGIDTVIAIANALLSVFFILVTKSITGLGLGLVLSVLLRAIISFYYVAKSIKIRISFREYDRALAKQLFSFGGYFQFARITNTVASNTDTLFIASFIGAAFIPAYTFTAKLSQLIGITIASKIPQALFSGMSQMVDNREHEKIKHVFNNLLRLLLRIALFMAAFNFFFNEAFVTLWVGKGNYGGYSLNIVFVLWILFETLFRGTSSIIYALNEIKGWSIACFFEASCNIILSILLIKKFGLVGVAVATVISRALTSGAYLFYVVVKKNILTRSVFPLLRDTLLRSIPAILFFSGIKWVLLHNFIRIGWFPFGMIAVVGFVVNILSFEGKILVKNRNSSFRSLFQILLSSNIK